MTSEIQSPSWSLPASRTPLWRRFGEGRAAAEPRSRMMQRYDVIVIGAGGYNAASRAGQPGLAVACVEGRETLGGT